MENLFEKYAGMNMFNSSLSKTVSTMVKSIPKANTAKESLKTIPRTVNIPKLPAPAANPVNAASKPAIKTNVLATGLGKPRTKPVSVNPALNGTVI